ncbi:CDP-alcohol phosphatidyltransferase family protein [Merismopedia glauca]|uniref:CDP-diacylglycerol--glycerol-3-phosphate 3-phosphatidyltransferase n=1 Tax=Merismopedia glauca CCAP 1448/3 TaxID=1296344 RepID=A0A2T1C197_9CYAN|nr:CDP-alcohol phosphatidyltransferase family protein [Merismopedia glauca]PSB02046.1 CDP-diacylglycerol--glycerol-3-phosphate 3-phosphatidyltransferase [Merismopedia glauca CCAP 1448/3]
MKLTKLPQLLVVLRFGIAPLLLTDALDGRTTIWFILGYIIAFFSDIFDGIIARRLGVSTVGLRQADSIADVCLYISIAICVWLVHPEIIIDFKTPLLIAIAAQLILYAISLIKFRKPPSFHTYTAKAWGISLFIATIGIFGFNWGNGLWLAIAFCLINTIEEIAMTLILPEWHHDILSIFHAWELKKHQRSISS